MKEKCYGLRTSVVVFILISLFCFLSFANGLCEEYKEKTLYFTLSDTDNISVGVPAHAISTQEENGKVYLFLPGNQDTNNLRVWFSESANVSINGTTYKSGDKCDNLWVGSENKFIYGKNERTLHVMQGSSIPSVLILTKTGSMRNVNKSKRYKEDGVAYVVDESGGVVYDGPFEHIKLRGNTSAKFKKKGYQVKFPEKVDILGMGKAKKWVLTSNYRDTSLLRNQITFDMARYVGLDYTAECRQVDVYLNHVYNGTYLLQEKNEIGKNRIDINDLEKETEKVNSQELSSYDNIGPKSTSKGKYKYIDIPNNPDDITGGYLLEYENWQVRYSDELCAYTTQKGKTILVKEPEYASENQMKYISSFIQGYENAMFSKDGIDPDSGKHYYEFVDLDSLVKKYMIEEISKNIDGNQSSQFYYKPADHESEIAFAGPVWDYDCSYGSYVKNEKEKRWADPEGFAHNKQTDSKYWWPELYKKPEFREKITELWNDRFKKAIDILLGRQFATDGLKSINEYTNDIEKSAAMNFIVFPFTQNNLSNCVNPGDNFNESIEYLKNFIEERYAFLDAEWSKNVDYQ